MKRKAIICVLLIFGTLLISLGAGMLLDFNSFAKLEYGGIILCGVLIIAPLLRKVIKKTRTDSSI